MTLRTISAVLLAALMTGPASAAPALWKVSDADSSVWLFGSVHLLKPNTDWRSDALNQLIAKADRVYFETDISAEAQATLAPLTMEVGFNRDGSLLSEHIGQELTERLRAVASTYDVPMPFLLTMQPWMAASTISVGVMAKAGYDPALGVETTLAKEIDRDRQGFLETPEQQLGFLAGGDMSEQIAMLQATLDTLDEMMSEIDVMVDAWMDGDPEMVGEIFTSQIGDYGDDMVKRLIDRRNEDWTNQIADMLARNEKALLVVGAAHITGDASVVKMLESRGFASERIQ